MEEEGSFEAFLNRVLRERKIRLFLALGGKEREEEEEEEEKVFPAASSGSPLCFISCNTSASLLPHRLLVNPIQLSSSSVLAASGENLISISPPSSSSFWKSWRKRTPLHSA